MIEKKFNIPLIILSLSALGIGFFGFLAESIIIALVTVIVSVKLRSKYLIRIPVAVSILTILTSSAFLAFIILHNGGGVSSGDYWFERLISGII